MKQSEAIRTVIFVLSLVLLPACQVAVDDERLPGFSGGNALAYVEEQMGFGPRYPGSPGHQQMQDWLDHELSDSGWVVERQMLIYKGTTLVNIIARQENPSEMSPLVLGAHYDTRSVADRDPYRQDEPVPGANDGASGVAVLLEIARIFAFSTSHNIILVFFDGEDQGRINEWDWAVGSRYYVSHLEDPVQAAVIVDMVGDRDLSLPIELASDPELVDSIWTTAEKLGYSQFIRTPGPTLIDDHIPFLQEGIPAVDIIDFDYPYWHTTQDDLDKVSAESLEAVGRVLEQWIQDMFPEAPSPSQ